MKSRHQTWYWCQKYSKKYRKDIYSDYLLGKLNKSALVFGHMDDFDVCVLAAYQDQRGVLPKSSDTQGRVASASLIWSYSIISKSFPLLGNNWTQFWHRVTLCCLMLGELPVYITEKNDLLYHHVHRHFSVNLLPAFLPPSASTNLVSCFQLFFLFFFPTPHLFLRSALTLPS